MNIKCFYFERFLNHLLIEEVVMEKSKFFEKYRIEEDDFNKTGLDWQNLMEIKNRHLENSPSLKTHAHYVLERLQEIDQVHTVRSRIKNAEHLIEKIIRKKIQNPAFSATIDNYEEVITDLIGIRALHLFKEDWTKIHDLINKTWELKENPVANIKEGDYEKLIKIYEDKGCVIKKHPFGYRSVHYLIYFEVSKGASIFIEIQVRTLFEEAWSEIDHIVRYPYDIENPILDPYLSIFNRLVGNANEMGSFINLLKNEVEKRNEKDEEELTKSHQIITDLQKQIQELKIEQKEKELLEQEIKKLGTQLVFSRATRTYRYSDEVFTTYTPNLSASHPLAISPSAGFSPSGVYGKADLCSAPVRTPHYRNKFTDEGEGM